MAAFGYNKRLRTPFDEAVKKTTKAFSDAGFGVLSDIDVQEKFQEKLGVVYGQYRIFGMCNPPRAFQALEADPEIGLLLPCNVIVYEHEDAVVVSTILPTKLFSVVDNPEILPLAEEVEGMVKQAIDSL